MGAQEFERRLAEGRDVRAKAEQDAAFLTYRDNVTATWIRSKLYAADNGALAHIGRTA
jgi:hypothetical protein